MLRDAAALVPEIGECAAAVVHDDAELIDADMEAQWASDRLADPPGSVETPEWRNNHRETLRKALDRIADTPALTPRGEAIKGEACRRGRRVMIPLARLWCAWTALQVARTAMRRAERAAADRRRYRTAGALLALAGAATSAGRRALLAR